MSKKCFDLCAAILGLALSVYAQGTIDEHGVYHPSEEEIAAHKRLNELLGKPTFITLRLVSIPHSFSHEKPSHTPPPYTVGDWISFQVFITQSLSENIVIWNHVWPYYEFRPELYKDGDILPYSKEAQERVDRADQQPPSGSGGPSRLDPGRELEWATVKMEDWYEPLGPGHYQLTVRKRFAGDGDWVQSNPVTFDVQLRKPATIPNTVIIKLVPSAFQEQPEQKLYRIGSDAEITVRVVNNSDQRIKIEVIDLYYGNRLQLFKDGVLVPYRDETAKLIHSKHESPRLVDLSYDLFLDPHTTSGLQNLNLKDWYGPLAPGLYRLVDRRRFEIEGPWTADSAELVFEVVRQGRVRHRPSADYTDAFAANWHRSRCGANFLDLCLSNQVNRRRWLFI
jgi:hypothetical protein